MGFSSGSGSGSLSGASDVIFSNLATNQVLNYDGTTSKWKNTALTKGSVGLTNVDNTADTAKPVSTAQQAALDLKVNTSATTSLVAGANITLTQSGSNLTIASTASGSSSSTGGMVLVSHGTSTSVARPSADMVLWVGEATPANMTVNDIWSSSGGLKNVYQANVVAYTFDGNITDWVGINTNVVQSTTVAHSGSGSLQATTTGTTTSGSSKGIASNGFRPATAGQTWTMESYVRADSTSVILTSHIEYFDASYNYLGAATDNPVTASSNGWAYTNVSGTTPAGTTQIHPVVTTTSTPATGLIFYVDDVKFTKSS